MEEVHPVTTTTVLFFRIHLAHFHFPFIPSLVEQIMPVALSDTPSSSEQPQELPRQPRPHTRYAFPALEHFRIKDIPPAAY